MYRTLAVTALAILFSVAARAEPFVFVSLPDTQRYSENLKPPHPLAVDPMGTYRYFVDQTRWIAEHAAERNIRCVIHLGDVVQTASDVAQWERAKVAMDVIHRTEIPYGVCIGNHDMDREPESKFENFLLYFGPDRFAEKPGSAALLRPARALISSSTMERTAFCS